MSKQYEHTISNGIDRVTDKETRAFRIGFSGSSAKPNCDVLVTTPVDDYALELKRTTKDVFYVDGEDLEQLVECANSYTSTWLIVKFNNREPVSVRYYGQMTGSGDWSEKNTVEQFSLLFPDCFEAAVTDGGNLRVEKPDTDEWSSAMAGLADEVAILRDLGISNPESTHV